MHNIYINIYMLQKYKFSPPPLNEHQLLVLGMSVGVHASGGAIFACTAISCSYVSAQEVTITLDRSPTSVRCDDLIGYRGHSGVCLFVEMLVVFVCSGGTCDDVELFLCCDNGGRLFICCHSSNRE